MKKKLTHWFVAMLLALSLLGMMTAQAYEIVGLTNFEKWQDYSETAFVDVEPGAWYEENVSTVYEYGLMSGAGNGCFLPNNKISLAESIVIAVRIYSTYWYGYEANFDPVEDGAWYAPYVTYALEAGIFENEYPDYTTIATRAQFARILAASIDDVDLQPINLVEDGAIPDVDMNADYADAVYLLYRAGVLSGSDANGTFNPDSTISRAEVAAIVTRMVDPTLRKTIELSGEY